MVDFKVIIKETPDSTGSDIAIEVDEINEEKGSVVEKLIGCILGKCIVEKANWIKEHGNDIDALKKELDFLKVEDEHIQ